MPERLAVATRAYDDATAHEVVDGPALAFRAWEARSNRLARSLRARGVRRGDAVALAFDDGDYLTHVVAYMGVQKAGAFCVIANVHLAAEELATVTARSEPVAVLSSGSCSAKLRPVVDRVDSIATWVTTGPVGSDLDIDRPVETSSWDAFLADDDTPVDVDIGDDDPADVLFTSGTTGTPRGWMCRHRNATHLEPGHVEEFTGAYFLHAVPTPSMVVQSLLITPAAMGMTSLFLPGPFEPDRWVDAVRRYRPTSTFLASSQARAIVAHAGVQPDDLASLTLVTVGNAPIDEEELLAFDRLLPNATPQNSYTLTELGTAFIQLPPDELHRRPHAVGRPYPPAEVRIVDPETGAPQPPGVVGSVLARAGDAAREPFPDEGEPGGRDRWLDTGDLGYLDEDGYLTITGRGDDLIIRGGFNIRPEDPERALREHPGVRDAAVVGVPHPRLGEDAVAFVVTDHTTDIGAEELEAWLRERLGEPIRPSRVVLVDALPRTATGKVLRRELRDIPGGG